MAGDAGAGVGNSTGERDLGAASVAAAVRGAADRSAKEKEVSLSDTLEDDNAELLSAVDVELMDVTVTVVESVVGAAVELVDGDSMEMWSGSASLSGASLSSIVSWCNVCRGARGESGATVV